MITHWQSNPRPSILPPVNPPPPKLTTTLSGSCHKQLCLHSGFIFHPNKTRAEICSLFVPQLNVDKTKSKYIIGLHLATNSLSSAEASEGKL